MSTARIITGDVREVLPTLEAESVQCVVTSPPYFGLRSYLPKDHPDKAKEIGTERTHVEYVEKIVGIFREVRRMLRDDGTCWINLGDSYAGSRGGPQGNSGEMAGRSGPASICRTRGDKGRTLVGEGLRNKNLLGVPWRVAFALQADGWLLRSEIIWSKPNPMPSSVTDRPTTSHEHLFLLSKSPRYFYDAKAIACLAPSRACLRQGQAAIRKRGKNEETPDRTRAGFNERWDSKEADGEIAPTRNKRSVWSISPASFDDAHFAVMPNELARTCILAGAGGHVLDPFAGAGTVGVESLKLGCDFTGIELYEANSEMARARIRDDAPLFNQTAVGE